MFATLLAIHLLLAIGLILLVLLQRNEGGALGIGGPTALPTGRSPGSALARSTGWLAFLFLLSSIGLTIMSERERTRSLLDGVIDAPGGRNAPLLAPAPVLPAPDEGDTN